MVDRIRLPGRRAVLLPAGRQSSGRHLSAVSVPERHHHLTTTSVTFAATYPVSASALFEAASAYNMRIITGKTWMDRNAPPQLLDTPESAYADSRELIRRWHGRGRNLYAITPRFAITSTFEELRLAGRLHAEYPSTYVHTHLSETRAEVQCHVA
ncbi:amidohydrolase family protein [Micromonospora sp. WMMA1363]|uniref:amidohydrolase family protein n=1 Tax=Micromonospora sp. WMMA1363 TaxID=3053985 RepID=UPI00259C9422|nr:amidohydrolase family protein [Micromonospora sp. WMMA1363]MDM4719580.1 amidohydrolase family protein [Micromonospora sp. WMMA1363]